MLQIVAKKYARALIESISKSELEGALQILKALSLVLKDKKNADILASPFVNKDKKEQFLLESAGGASEKVRNFFRLIASSNRILLIPHITDEIERSLLAEKKEYGAMLSSKENLDSKTLEKIADALAKKLGVNLSIKQELSSSEGIRLSVEDLGIEVSFSKERFSSDLKAHILKAL